MSLKIETRFLHDFNAGLTLNKESHLNAENVYWINFEK